MAAVLRTVGGLPFSALRLTLRLLRRVQRGPAPRHLLPVAGLDHERAAPVLFALREAAHEAEVGACCHSAGCPPEVKSQEAHVRLPCPECQQSSVRRQRC